jgi:hypothetical protein
LDPDSIGLADPDCTQSEFNLSPLLLKFAQSFAYSSVALVEAGGYSGGSVIKLPPRSGAVITNYGSRSGSLQFYQRLKEIVQKKIMFDAVLRIRDVYPGSRILIFTHPGSRIPDLGSRIQKQQQKREVKKISCHTFFM